MSGKFEPKQPVTLAPPKDDPITVEELAKANGKCAVCPLISQARTNTFIGTGEDGKCYVAIKGKVYDVTGKPMYQPGGSYSGMSPWSRTIFGL